MNEPLSSPLPVLGSKEQGERTSDLFEKAFHNSPAMHSIVRFSDGVLVEVNETFTRTLGYNRDEVLGKTPFELNFWVTPERLQSYRAQLETQGFVRDFETQVRTKEGRIRTVLLSSDLVEIDGTPYSLTAGVDISERKRSEKIQQATYQISESAYAAEDLTSLYAQIHVIIKGLMRAENFYIAVFDSVTELISFPYFIDERSQRPEPFRIGTGLTGYVLHTGRPLLLDAAMNARKQLNGGKVTFEGFEDICYVESGEPSATWLGVPLSIQGKAIGVMAVQDYCDGQAYGEEEKQILAFVATQTALAIDRKRGQRALQENEKKYRALFEGSSQGVLIQDEEKFLEVNSATLRILGLDSPDSILGTHPKDSSPPFQPNGESSDVASRRHITECMQNGSVRFDWVGLNSRGHEVPLEVILTRVELGGRNIIQAVINDISERKKAESELRASEVRLRESEARFSTAFHASPVLMTIATLNDTRFVEVNEAFMQTLGLKRTEVIGRNSLELSLWLSENERARFFERLKEEGSLRNVEAQTRGRYGMVHTMQISADIIEINRQPHLLTFALDISERKRAETELHLALEKERELSQLKSNFVSLVSHEFRTPLEIIMSSADNLDRYHDRLAPDKRHQLLRTINRSVSRMSGMMEEVLVLGRLETDRMTFRPVLFDLRALSQRVCDEIESATGKRCAIEFRMDATPDQAFGDESVLRHIFTNLLSNGVKYSPPGETVQLTIQREGDDAICSVADNGCGIPDSDQKRLFQAFHRGSNVRQIPGTGLGLLIVRRCVDLHGGEIQFESNEGRGTTFSVRLPLFAPRGAQGGMETECGQAS
jgi:PAS domain S-box-containing protein